MEDCIFCRIVAGNSPASIFYEDELVLGIMDIGPLTSGHVLIIPRLHAPYLADLDEATGQHIWTIAQRSAAALRSSGLKCEGVNFFLADGEAAFQEIFHLHLHVFPRYKGDPFRLDADWDIRPPREELDQVAGMMRQAYTKLWGSQAD